MENNVIIFETDRLLLKFSKKNGALIFLKDKFSGWVIHKSSELGLSFKMIVPVSNSLRNNPVFGEKQTVSKIEVGTDYVRFIYNGVISERAGKLPITVTAEIKREGNQAVWYTHIQNDSDYVIESVYSPCIGDLKRPDDKPFKSFVYFYGSASESNIYPTFDNQRGDHGIERPIQITDCWSSSPATPFILLRNEDLGLYVGVKDKNSELVAWHLELYPGYGSAMENQIPTELDVDKPVHIEFSPIHQPYIMPKESRSLTPIAIEPFTGSWYNGVDVYKRWINSVSSLAYVPKWANTPHSWLQIHLNSPESELRFKFTDLPAFAKECKKHGVSAIQLVGWNDGGQDQNNPSHDYDKRLGTLEELKQAIKDCQKLGVKVIIFTKFTWADQATGDFKKNLIDYAVKNPYGDYSVYQGYMYFTPAQLLDINTKRLIPMCFGAEGYVNRCKEEFRKVLDLGADGMLFDECEHHGGTLLCFDTAHNHRYGAPVYKYDLPFINALREMTDDKEYLFSGEACYDLEFEGYSLSYFRSRNKKHYPVSRYLRPDGVIMTAVSGFNDRNMINQCLLYKYVISYEPYYFKGHLTDFPKTVSYGEKMDSLRVELKDYLWDGEFLAEEGVKVIDERGKIHHPYSRFLGKNGNAVVIANYEDFEIKVKIKTEGFTLKKYRTVEDEIFTKVPETVCIPARSAVVLI